MLIDTDRVLMDTDRKLDTKCDSEIRFESCGWTQIGNSTL